MMLIALPFTMWLHMQIRWYRDDNSEFIRKMKQKASLESTQRQEEMRHLDFLSHLCEYLGIQENLRTSWLEQPSMGFEPMHKEPNESAGHRLHHSATSPAFVLAKKIEGGQNHTCGTNACFLVAAFRHATTRSISMRRYWWDIHKSRNERKQTDD